MFENRKQVESEIKTGTEIITHFKMGHSRPLFFFSFCLFYFNVQLVDKSLPMLGLDLRISGVGSNCSAN